MPARIEDAGLSEATAAAGAVQGGSCGRRQRLISKLGAALRTALAPVFLLQGAHKLTN